MTERYIETETADGIARIALARAPVNALSAAFLDEFATEIRRLSADDAVRAIVLTSPFRVFSAGLDLKEAQAFDTAQQNDIVRALDAGFLALFACPKPTVAAVNGAAIAGGLFFVLAADWRLTVPGVPFGLAEVRVGADFPIGPMEIARGTLDPNCLRRLMLTGQPVMAEAARNLGFIDDIVAPDALLPAAMAKARELSALPPLAYASVKRQIRGAAIARIEKSMAAPRSGWFTHETAAAMQRMIGG